MHPVAAALEQYRAEVLVSAETDATALVDRLLAKLGENEWNLDKVAPKVERGDSEHLRTAKMNSRSLYQSVAAWTQVTFFAGESIILKACDRKRAAFINSQVDAVNCHFNGFVAKMASKISSAGLTGVEITGSIAHCRSHGQIIATFADDTVDVWNIQPVQNVSKLGRPYMQWRATKAR